MSKERKGINMTEEKKEVYEIEKSFVKQFLVIVCGSFIGCLIALLLMAHILKPKCPPMGFYHPGMMPPPIAHCHCPKARPDFANPPVMRDHQKFRPHHVKTFDKKSLPTDREKLPPINK